jgi:hypothetical protein
MFSKGERSATFNIFLVREMQYSTYFCKLLFHTNEELYVLYSTNIIQVTKSRRKRWTGGVAHMRDRRGASRILVAKPERTDHFEGPCINGKILFNCDL